MDVYWLVEYSVHAWYGMHGMQFEGLARWVSRVNKQSK